MAAESPAAEVDSAFFPRMAPKASCTLLPSSPPHVAAADVCSAIQGQHCVSEARAAQGAGFPSRRVQASGAADGQQTLGLLHGGKSRHCNRCCEGGWWRMKCRAGSKTVKTAARSA